MARLLALVRTSSLCSRALARASAGSRLEGRADRVALVLGVLRVGAQDAEAGAGDGGQRVVVAQLVLAVAEEGEVVVGEPAQQLAGLLDLLVAAGRRGGSSGSSSAMRSAASRIFSQSSTASRTSDRTRSRSAVICLRSARSVSRSISTWIQDSTMRVVRQVARVRRRSPPAAVEHLDAACR